jgi:bifunctional UDP-N-acetylglucosamine pyrophosphorylase / glucosamine-1-phosphate N-acetyltransferase
MTVAGALVSSEEAAAFEADWSASASQAVAVIAAAGRGTRLGYHQPKLLYPIEGRALVVWLAERLAGLVERLTIVLSPDGRTAFEAAAPALGMAITTVIQQSPTGMADAILAAEAVLCAADAPPTAVILWGDQIGVRRETVARALAVHARHPLHPAVTVPLARVDAPYVHYEFDAHNRLVAVRQRREGDVLPDVGHADCGCFVVSPARVYPLLRRLRSSNLLEGPLSREQNFLQALPFIAREAPVVGVTGATLADTIGLNSTSDLARLVRASGPHDRSPR